MSKSHVSYILEVHEPDVLRSLRGLTNEEYEEILVAIAAFRRPLGVPVIKYDAKAVAR